MSSYLALAVIAIVIIGAAGLYQYQNPSPQPATCPNGAVDYPTCSFPPTPTCSNGATNYPTCTFPGGGGTNPPPVTQNTYVMMNLITWTSNNGLSTLDWDAITDISVFHVAPTASGGIAYDGSAVNVQSLIQTAHSKGKRASLAIGGAGLDFTATNDMLKSPAQRTKVQDALMAEVAKGYDAIELDFEDHYDKAGMTAFTKETCTKIHAVGKQCNQAVADWFSSSLDIPQIDPFIDHFHYMFYDNDGETVSIQAFASSITNPKNRLAVGFNLDSGGGIGTPTVLESRMSWVKQQGYQYMFWRAGFDAYYPTIKKIAFSSPTQPPVPTGDRRLLHSVYTTTSTQPVIDVIKKHYCGNHFDILSDDKALTGPFLLACVNSLGQPTYDYRGALIGVSLTSIPTKQDHATKYKFGKEDIIYYDLEHWTNSPQSEQDNPIGSTHQFADAVHSLPRVDGGKGYSFSTDFDGDFWLTPSVWQGLNYTKIEMNNIQMQRYSRNDNGILISTIKPIADFAKSKNPSVQNVIQISFRQSANNYNNGNAINVAQSMANLKATILALSNVPSVDGVRIVYLPDGTNVCDPSLCTPSNLDEILTYVESLKK